MRDSHIRMETQLKDLTVQLLGGEGRKGAIPMLFERQEQLGRDMVKGDSENTEHVEKVKSRVENVERKFVWVSGAAAVIGFIFSWAATWFASYLSGRHTGSASAVTSLLQK